MTLKDSSTLNILDEVSRDSNTWISTQSGYSYELLSNDYNNSWGDNWVQSCSIFGTPGSNPVSSCNTGCTIHSCAPFSCQANGQCDCTPFGIYYPSCNGESCPYCKLVPKVSSCHAKWINNGTDKYAIYYWTPADVDISHRFKLSYFAQSTNGITLDVLTNEDDREIIIYDYYRGQTEKGGYVTTIIEVLGVEYESDVTWCDIITASPTLSPSDGPTSFTLTPTNQPTVNPTLKTCCGCLSSSGIGGCSDVRCEIEICDGDTFCCTTQWDTICALQAKSICNDQPIPTCCLCAISTDFGCDETECNEQICQQDEFCCENSFDHICVQSAYEICQSNEENN